MENLRFLASYKDDNIVITAKKTENILDVVKKVFSLPGNCDVKLQVFDTEWKEWVNKDPKEIINRDKVKVISKKQPEPSPVVPKTGIVPSWIDDDIGSLAGPSSSSLHLPQTHTNASLYETCFILPDGEDLSSEVCLESLESGEDSTSLSDAIADMVDSSSSLPSSTNYPVSQQIPKQVVPNSLYNRMDKVSLKPWPAKFDIPLDSMPVDLRNTLEEGIYPNERQRRKLVQILFDKTAEYVRYPTKSQYTDVATALVEKFPCLAFNDIPSVKPHEYWKTKLSDKFRNERKHFNDGLIKRQPKRKRVELPVDTEDERSIEMHQRWMKEEIRKKTKNKKKMAELMKLTFPTRRRSIVEDGALVKTIRENYPALFETEELLQEFQRITGKEMFPTIRDSLTGISSKVVKFAEKQEPKKKLLRSLELQKIFTVEQTKKKELENTCAVFILSKLLSSKDILCNEEDRDMNTDITSPTIFWRGQTPCNADRFIIHAENEAFGDTTDVITALGNLMATYWIFNMSYPQESKDFFIFTEMILLKLTNGKPTRAVNNLVSILKGF
ncbi:sterile alpha motif domain-containing protein 3-like [Apostichopus japonicus]|uniref:sterile alpha motif domain-containing protein 3-like n=1 Tax=Stichopus japonicus TaxID=307972 RepID=UPI003AB170CF